MTASEVQRQMMVASVTAAKGTPITGETAQQIGGDFMTLLVAQLQNQDPLEPMDGSEFMSQLVQLQSLAELTQIRAGLGELGGGWGLGRMVGLVGRNVEWLDTGTGGRLMGVVSRIEAGTDGSCALVVNGTRVGLDQVVAVS